MSTAADLTLILIAIGIGTLIGGVYHVVKLIGELRVTLADETYRLKQHFEYLPQVLRAHDVYWRNREALERSHLKMLNGLTPDEYPKAAELIKEFDEQYDHISQNLQNQLKEVRESIGEV